MQLTEAEFRTLWKWSFENIAVVANTPSVIYPADKSRVAVLLPAVDAVSFYSFVAGGSGNQGIATDAQTGEGHAYFDLLTHGTMVQETWQVDIGISATISFYSAHAPLDVVEAYERVALQKAKMLSVLNFQR